MPQPQGSERHQPVTARPAVSSEIFGALINLAGRQRMLSQRIILHAVLASLKHSKAIETARGALKFFRDSHVILVQGGDGLPGIFLETLRVAYFGDLQGDRKIQDFISLTENALKAIEGGSAQAPALLATLVENTDPMLQLLNQITVIYENESKSYATVQKKHLHDIMGNIKTIAKRARIVSFNAQIVASRAGPAGREFAVVASELSKITEEIDGLVHLALDGSAASAPDRKP